METKMTWVTLAKLWETSLACQRMNLQSEVAKSKESKRRKSWITDPKSKTPNLLP
jgi:hypothetical protein